MSDLVTHIIALSVLGLLVMAFVLLAWKDMLMLVTRPAPGMGRGTWRVWAVARTTVAETWAGRAWVLPPLWLIASLILIWVVRPFDESERIPLYLRVLLMGQEWLLMVMIGVMACLSMPRERERKIVITNASKPLSRLEMYLGKIVGFAVTAFLLLMAMGLMSWAILALSDYRIRGRASEQYRLAENDYEQAVQNRQRAMMAQGQATTRAYAEPPPVLPPESVKQLAAEGSLFAYNYITVPAKSGFSIAGFIDFKTNPPTRYIRGGSQQKILYTFTTDNGKSGIFAPEAAVSAPAGARPYFVFHYGVVPYSEAPLGRIQINITAQLTKSPAKQLEMKQQEKTLTLDANNSAKWEPERPDELFGTTDSIGPVEISVQCPTPGVLLEVLEGQDPDAKTGQLNVGAEAFNVLAAPDRDMRNGVYTPQAHPEIVGFERHDKQQIAGPDPKERDIATGAPRTEMAVYRFKGSDLQGIPIDENGNFAVAMNFDIDKQAYFEWDTEAVVSAYNQEAPQTGKNVRIQVVEKRVTLVNLPAALLGTNPDPKQRGDLIIAIACATPSHWIELNENSVRIELPRSLFVLNLLKSELVLFCEMLLLIVICVTCSLRLGWPVAVLTASFCVLLGFVWPFVSGLAQANGLSALGFRQNNSPDAGYRFADALVSVTYYLLNLAVSALPDFTRFDALRFIVDLRNIPVGYVLLDAGFVLFFALPVLAVGYMQIRKQELG